MTRAPVVSACNEALASDDSNASDLIEATVKAEESVREMYELPQVVASDDAVNVDGDLAKEGLSDQNGCDVADPSQEDVSDNSSSSIKLGSEPADSSVNSLLNRAMTDTWEQCTAFWWQNIVIPASVRDLTSPYGIDPKSENLGFEPLSPFEDADSCKPYD